MQSMSTCFSRHNRTHPTGRLLFIIVALLIAGSYYYSLTPGLPQLAQSPYFADSRSTGVTVSSALAPTAVAQFIHTMPTAQHRAYGHLYLNLGERTIPSCLKKHKRKYQCCSTSVLPVWAISSAGLCPSQSASPEVPCRRPTRFVFSPRLEMFHHRRTPCPFPISIHRPALPHTVRFGGLSSMLGPALRRPWLNATRAVKR
ncbi:hypothetical protein FVEG_15185 [Fusarium verticillioides 7600]|uniref:Uncharacterized protein n=1 Tax=Gibberella moniliformis (strain M3125 / FGSC 7600) TaxID=334819 RepID=W7LZL0_GIBM7|nr:hypothetical protein FVEG_15185 [Fusarium verticillioides 7600]XP_018747056.1 hypothetical protein FVEG_15185 [Fusarium verticillioides 7600]EWG40864.1 hypothetical protein FVEG_15185 [Fusarium verticillioides 7600]EWG40865.1 hypothetical protein FVEG_15185 [Fusarium verticillioides 7600]